MRNFPGMSVEDLERFLKWTLEEIATGKVNVALTEQGVGVTKFVDPNLPATVRRDLLLEDLRAVRPNDERWAGTERVTRTTPRFL